jgi:hypothetical protein
VTYRAELSRRALSQVHGLSDPAFDSLIEAMAEVIGYPGDPLRTFATLRQARRVRRCGPDYSLSKRRRQRRHHPRHHLDRLAPPAATVTTTRWAGVDCENPYNSIPVSRWSQPGDPRACGRWLLVRYGSRFAIGAWARSSWPWPSPRSSSDRGAAARTWGRTSRPARSSRGRSPAAPASCGTGPRSARG